MKEEEGKPETPGLEAYEMNSNEFDFDEIKAQSNFGIKQYRDSLYRGQIES
jgi:hypothetical protein